MTDLTPLQIAQNTFRQHRNVALAATDWAILPDSPLPEAAKTAYGQYRQFLRDLPSTLTDKDFNTFSGVIPDFDAWQSAQASA